MSYRIPTEEDTLEGFLLLEDLIRAVTERMKRDRRLKVKITLHWLTEFHGLKCEPSEGGPRLEFCYRCYELKRTSHRVPLRSYTKMRRFLSKVLSKLIEELRTQVGLGRSHLKVLRIRVDRCESSDGIPLIMEQTAEIAGLMGFIGSSVTPILGPITNRILMARRGWIGLFEFQQDPDGEERASITLVAPLPLDLRNVLVRLQAMFRESREITEIVGFEKFMEQS